MAVKCVEIATLNDNFVISKDDGNENFSNLNLLKHSPHSHAFQEPGGASNSFFMVPSNLLECYKPLMCIFHCDTCIVFLCFIYPHN